MLLSLSNLGQYSSANWDCQLNVLSSHLATPSSSFDAIIALIMGHTEKVNEEHYNYDTLTREEKKKAKPLNLSRLRQLLK